MLEEGRTKGGRREEGSAPNHPSLLHQGGGREAGISLLLPDEGGRDGLVHSLPPFLPPLLPSSLLVHHCSLSES
ncbi:hypothetical protein CesoFtcFv8_015832 [Champsocephalus esox]|uniref:Uncharacterized protein n=1 Tax=Champsocephalus esox TaxID=159716 RepID=A0AAN8BLK1_9TELE|nr:hypothetical protein CesoFtcFv8_015832 [Champsocephalus esox]